jgi:hypothetical protein
MEKAAINIGGLFLSTTHVRGRCPIRPAERSSATLRCERILAPMDKKEIESPKLTENFLVWIGAFMLLLFLLLAHFVWRVF